MYITGPEKTLENRLHAFAVSVQDLNDFWSEYQNNLESYEFHQKNKIEREISKKYLLIAGTSYEDGDLGTEIVSKLDFSDPNNSMYVNLI